MNKNKVLLFIIATIMTGSIQNIEAQATQEGKKILIVYYSWSESGNTRSMAQQIQAATGADVFEIIPAKAYPSDYQATVAQAKTETNNRHRPEIKGSVKDFASYDIVIVGSPNWWSTIAPPVATFLANHDFKGKTILPFITHEGSRMGRSASDIKEICPGAVILEGLPVRGGSVRGAGDDIKKWFRDRGIIK